MALELATRPEAPGQPDGPAPTTPVRHTTLAPPAMVAMAVTLAVAAGVVLRFLADTPMWLDEAQSMAIARLPVPSMFDALRQDGAPPLYYLLLHGWTDVFGSGDATARALSGVCSVAALPAFYVLGRDFGGRSAGLVVLGVAAVNPWLIRYATEARMYSLVVLLVLLLTIAVHRLFTRPTTAVGVGIATLSAALLYTHYWGLYILAALGVVIVARAVLRQPARPDRAEVTGVAALAAAGMLFLPWLPSLAYQVGHTGTPWAGPPTSGMLVEIVREWFDAGVPMAGWLALLLWPLVLLGALTVRPARHGGTPAEPWHMSVPADRRWLLALFLLTLLIAYAGCAVTGSAFTGRYTAVVLPLCLILLGLGITALPPGALRPVLVGVLAVWFVADLRLATSVRSQSGDIATVLNSGAAPGDVVVYCPDQLSPSVSRRLRVAVTQLPYPSATSPERVNWVDYEQRNMAADPERFADRLVAAGETGTRIWLVRQDGYRTYEVHCMRLTDRIAETLGEPDRVLSQDPAAFERAMLLRWVVPAANQSRFLDR